MSSADRGEETFDEKFLGAIQRIGAIHEASPKKGHHQSVGVRAIWLGFNQMASAEMQTQVVLSLNAHPDHYTVLAHQNSSGSWSILVTSEDTRESKIFHITVQCIECEDLQEWK